MRSRPGTRGRLEGKTMPNRYYAVVCSTCLYRSGHSSRWEANIDLAAHLRDNPTHSATVVEEGQGTNRTSELSSSW